MEETGQEPVVSAPRRLMAKASATFPHQPVFGERENPLFLLHALFSLFYSMTLSISLIASPSYARKRNKALMHYLQSHLFPADMKEKGPSIKKNHVTKALIPMFSTPQLLRYPLSSMFFQIFIQLLIQILKRQLVFGRMAGMCVCVGGGVGWGGGTKLQLHFLARKK